MNVISKLMKQNQQQNANIRKIDINEQKSDDNNLIQNETIANIEESTIFDICAQLTQKLIDFILNPTNSISFGLQAHQSSSSFSSPKIPSQQFVDNSLGGIQPISVFLRTALIEDMNLFKLFESSFDNQQQQTLKDNKNQIKSVDNSENIKNVSQSELEQNVLRSATIALDWVRRISREVRMKREQEIEDDQYDQDEIDFKQEKNRLINNKNNNSELEKDLDENEDINLDKLFDNQDHLDDDEDELQFDQKKKRKRQQENEQKQQQKEQNENDIQKGNVNNDLKRRRINNDDENQDDQLQNMKQKNDNNIVIKQDNIGDDIKSNNTQFISLNQQKGGLLGGMKNNQDMT